MGLYAAGQVVFLTFPFSDLSDSKLRPGLLLASAGNEDWIVCQITSNPYIDPSAISLSQDDFRTGGLPRLSYIRPAKLFTANQSVVSANAGLVTPEALNRVREAVIGIIRPPQIEAY